MKKILEVKNICKTYQAKNGEIEALKNISFDIKEGEYISIIGPSGCGKSTLLSIISGLENKSSGEIYIDGKIGYMLQKDNLLEWRTIYKNVLLGLEIQKENTSENREYVEKLLKKYGLYEFKEKYPAQLSGGMRQRVVIAIALACEPNLIVADEPTTALDAAMQVRVIRLLKKIVKETNTALLLVSHNMGVIAAACDYVYVMKDGKMEDQGTREYILHETRNAYTRSLLGAVPSVGGERYV